MFLSDQRGARLLYLDNGDACPEKVKKRLELAEQKQLLLQQEMERRKEKSAQDIKELFQKGNIQVNYAFFTFPLLIGSLQSPLYPPNCPKLLCLIAILL